MIGPCTHYGRPRWCCPTCAAEAVLLLLRSGRVAMARRLIEDLPGLIRDQIGCAYAAGHDRRGLAQRAREGLGGGARQRVYGREGNR
jgi:hypothetical protein